jgi:hypothetical protein
MKKAISIFLVLSFFLYIFGCSGSRNMSVEDPEIGKSVKIILIDGAVKEGVLLKKEGSKLTYIDTASNMPEELEIKKVRMMEYANKVYDLEGKIISDNEISVAKGFTKTIGYGLGGLVLGAAVGFGVGVLIASSESVPLIYPMGALGLAGGIYFGIHGAQRDREDAIDEIRRERYKVTQVKLRKKLEEEKKKLQEQQAEKDKMLKELKKKKK